MSESDEEVRGSLHDNRYDGKTQVYELIGRIDSFKTIGFFQNSTLIPMPLCLDGL